ncbi:ROK family [Acididesulfobacillus acetoxydans]|uniref:ROK family n=1 Tax=Acididesulfobacillus acetoxydans TaxID=1561005 RepID=A0A8S0W4V9_9FIRM|nr:ROK family protein [Acididesulfobacillus acetoxydans]CAA7602628.1 ROK family [Acididesulfobacillus acetoxydans]CEJ09175.1 ROK family [Acididesulfobacillus acetoxydans]
MSKAELSRITGISAPTILKIIDYFIKIGCVVEVGEGDAALGRKPQMLRLNSQAAFAIGVEFNGFEIKMGIVDMAGEICKLRVEAAVPSFKKVIGIELVGKLKELIAESKIPTDKILGVCIGVPGVINPESRTIDLAPLEGVTESTDYARIIEDLTRHLNMPVIIENDANAAVIGEFHCRGFGNRDDLLFILIGKGIGAGIIFDGKIRRGRSLVAGEIGYMVFDEKSVTDKKQEGWLEKKLNLDLLMQSRNNVPEEYFDTIAANLALVIVNICVPLEINHIVLGHIIDERFDTRLLERINTYVRSLSVLDLICQFPLCREPVIAGCANLVMEPVLDRILTD